MIRSKIAMGFLWILLALHVWPGMVAPAHAQGSRKDDIVFNSRGIPLAGGPRFRLTQSRISYIMLTRKSL